MTFGFYSYKKSEPEKVPVQFEIKLREFDHFNRRLGNAQRVITRAASSEKEARNKAYIAYDRCMILSCIVKEQK